MGNSFSTCLRAARKSRGMTQKELSRACRIAQPLLSYYETGRMMPTLGNATRIADALDCSLDWLAGRSEQNGHHRDNPAGG